MGPESPLPPVVGVVYPWVAGGIRSNLDACRTAKRWDKQCPASWRVDPKTTVLLCCCRDDLHSTSAQFINLSHHRLHLRHASRNRNRAARL